MNEDMIKNCLPLNFDISKLFIMFSWLLFFISASADYESFFRVMVKEAKVRDSERCY